MTQWKRNVRRLYELGGTATTDQIDDGMSESPAAGLSHAKCWGLVSGGGHASNGGRPGSFRPATWTLTPLGEAWVLGRVEARSHYRGGVKTWFAPTWLSVLPTDARIEGKRVCCACEMTTETA